MNAMESVPFRHEYKHAISYADAVAVRARALAVIDVYKRQKENEKQSYPVMTISAKGVSGSTVTYSRVITLASTEMFNAFTQYSSTANSDCAVTLFRFLSGTTGDEDKVFIDSTKLTSTDFTVSSGMVNVVGMTIFMILVPLLVLAAGLIVWLRRRHL